MRRRVTNLDWSRDPELSVAVNLDLSRPDKLDSLNANIPQMMINLAQKDVVDEHFRYIAWRPQKRSRPILIPVPQNAVEDAMEAILEDMEDSEKKEDSLDDKNTQANETSNGQVIEEAVEVEPVIEPAFEEIVVSEIPVKEIVQETIEVGPVISDIPSPPDIIEGISPSLELLLRSLGLRDEADLLADKQDIASVRRTLASHVGVEPRDMRLDRLLRLSLRLMPKGDDDDGRRYPLLATLAELADVLSKWTRTRLEARHDGSKGVLLDDASKLGQALQRIPGPGTPIPLEADDYELPNLDNITGLSNEVKILKRRVLLANAGGVR